VASINVRPARIADAPGMAVAHLEAWRVGYRGLLPDAHLDGLDAGQRTAAWEQLLGEADVDIATMVAVVDAEVAGISTIGPYRPVDGQPTPPDLCELWMLNVHPDHWGTGVAQALMAEDIAWLGREREEPRAALWVLEGNARGRRFYEKEGWSADGTTRHDAVGGVDVVELRYVRPL
jgi:GNAT superfamily N-acetyltransferase